MRRSFAQRGSLLAALLCSSLGLLGASCARKGVQDEVTVDGRVTTDLRDLRSAGPVDVLVLPVQNEVGELLPTDLIELPVRQVLLGKRYSVLSRELAYTRADEILSASKKGTEPTWRDRVPGAKAEEAGSVDRAAALARGWKPGSVGEDAFFRVVVHSFKIPPSGPIRQLEIDADFELIGAVGASAGKTLWSYKGAHAIVPVDGFGDRMRSRQENLRSILTWYVEAILEHLPESEGLNAGSGEAPIG